MKKELDRQEGKERKDEMDMKLIMTERVAQPYELMLKAEDQLKVFENRVQDSLHMQ